MRTPILALFILCTSGSLYGQRLRWDLDEFATAHFERQTRVHTEILDPAPLTPSTSEPSAIAGVAVRARTMAVGKNLLLNPSAEKLSRKNPDRWAKLTFAGSGKFDIDRKQARAGHVSLVIHSTPDSNGRKRGFDAAWVQGLKVQKNSRYRLSGWIKTEAVDRGAGARIGIVELGQPGLTKPVLATSDWTKVEIEFETNGLEAIRVSCTLGAFYQTRGKAWFDMLSLVKLGKPAKTVSTFAQKLFPGKRPPSVLQGRQLDPKRQYIPKRSNDLRDLAMSLGLDLRRTSHSIKLKKQIMELRSGFERIQVETTFGAVQADGTQKIITKFAAMKRRRVKKAKVKRTRNGKIIKPKVAPITNATLVRISGELSIQRQLNMGRHRVENFTSKLVMRVEMPKSGGLLPNSKINVCRLIFGETWTWLRHTSPNDSVFQARVNNAIHIGARHLRAEISKRMPGTGKLALAILTLIKSGVDPRDDLVRRALDRLRKSRMSRTYDLATAIMAIEAVYAPEGERDSIIAGRLLKPTPRKPSPADKKLLEGWVKKLLGNCDQRVQNAYSRRWNYTPGKRFDNSNSQYAALGLYTAMLCGVEISPTVWFAAANHWLDSQCKAEKKLVLLKIVTHQEIAAAEREHRKAVARGNTNHRGTVKSGIPTKARGWGYTHKGSRPTGSMTAAGITGLVICDSALRQHDKGTLKLRNRMQNAVDSGFAWLARHFTVETNPKGGKHWHLYYLYGLERACELNSTAIFQGRRWYGEGAELLMGTQSPEGKWGSIENTCFAILFLKKAAPPVITGR